MKKIAVLIFCILFTFSCTNKNENEKKDDINPPMQEINTSTGSNEEKIDDNKIGMPNPASKNCIDKGGQLVFKEGTNGTYGVCVFEDNLQCEEWAMMRGDCPVGGIKVTGYDNDGQILCAITGAKVDMSDSTCEKKDGTKCKITEKDLDCENM